MYVRKPHSGCLQIVRESDIKLLGREETQRPTGKERQT